MDERGITQNLIRVLIIYGITKNWDVPKLLEEYERYGIPRKLVDETLNEGM